MARCTNDRSPAGGAQRSQRCGSGAAGRDKPALLLRPDDQAIPMELANVKGLVTALVDGAEDPSASGQA